MAYKTLSAILIILFLGSGCSTKSKLVSEVRSSFSFQKQILSTILGNQNIRQEDDVYYWPKASNPQAVDSSHLGTTVNIDYLGEHLSTVREDRGTHCVGMSWQVCITVLQKWAHAKSESGKIADMTVNDMKDFVDKWFVKLKGAALAVPNEMGAVYALTSHKLGEQIRFENAQAGDFVQFWRKDNSGHSCIFLHWVYDNQGEIIGFKYWGSQPTTNGIGTLTEYFAPEEYTLKPEKLLQKKRFYIGRLAPLSN
jgi:hypothetical protein